MNVFDFDKTLYCGDSTLDFYLFCLRRQPGILCVFPKQLWSFIRFASGFIARDAFKEEFYRFLPILSDVENKVESFWKEQKRKMNPMIFERARKGDVVVSASPEFLLRAPCEMYELGLVASKVNLHTGRLEGKNCRGAEKVRRFLEEFPSASVDEFYSDSLSDAPMAALATKSYLVVHGKPIEWP